MGRETYIRVNAYGQIMSRYSSDHPHLDPSYILVSSIEDKELLQGNILSGTLYWNNGRIMFKPVITLTCDKSEYIAGIEIAKVTLSGIPEGYTKIAMQVGSSFVDLPVGETLEVTSITPQHIMVAVTEPILYSEVLTIRFVPEVI